jgi:hypothetical protein
VNIIAGQALYDALQAEKARRCRRNAEDLCRVQEEIARRGIVGAQLVQSIYGWGVRYDSGLQNWGLIASSRAKQVDGTLEDAERFALAWVAEDPARRYAWRMA